MNKAEWIAVENAYGEIKYKCSRCGHFVKSGTDKNFCPNCGEYKREQERR